MSSNIWPVLAICALDYVFWPYFEDSYLARPLSTNSTTGEVVDVYGEVAKYHKEVPDVLSKLRQNGVRIAVISYTRFPDSTTELLHLLNFAQYINYKNFNMQNVINQIERIHNVTRVSYSDMLYFADHKSYTKESEKLGVLGVLSNKGLSLKKLEEGLQLFRERKLNETAASA